MTSKPLHGEKTDLAHGTMDLTEHLRTWHTFTVGVKWTIIVSAGIVILLAIFRTN